MKSPLRILVAALLLAAVGVVASPTFASADSVTTCTHYDQCHSSGSWTVYGPSQAPNCAGGRYKASFEVTLCNGDHQAYITIGTFVLSYDHSIYLPVYPFELAVYTATGTCGAWGTPPSSYSMYSTQTVSDVCITYACCDS